MSIRSFAAALALLPLGPAFAADEGEVDLSPYYGFGEVEVYKLDDRSSDLRAADLDADGRTDLILVDNGHSRLDLLRQREKPPEGSEKAPAGEVNFVPNSWRFEHVKIPVDRQVASLVTGDFDGDGRQDIAYVGLPDRLVLRFSSKENPQDWSKLVEQRLPDLNAAGVILASGDLNGDKRDDLAVLGKSKTYVVLQGEDGKLAPATGLMNTSDGLALVQSADLDGDGREDLCYTASDGSNQILCSRLQTPQGSLGPELQFPLAKPRSVTLRDVDKQPGTEILSIDTTTGRLAVSKLRRPEEKSGELAGRLVHYGFGDQSARNERDLAVGDLDGDGKLDIVVTDPAGAGMIVFRQREGSGLDLGTTFPGLVGAEHVRLADFDGDRKAEAYVLSDREGTVGVSRFEDDRLTFPKPIAVGADPLAMELADVNGDGKSELVVVAKGKETGKFAFRAYRPEGENWAAVPFGASETVEVALKGAPEQLAAFDGNRDGKSDFVAFLGQGRPPHVFLSGTEAALTELSSSGGIGLNDVAAGGFSAGTVRDPEAEGSRAALLVSQGSFARNLELKDGRWRVVDQYNADETGAKIEGAATLDLDGEAGNEIVLVDTGVRKLRVLKADGALYKPWKEVETGPFPYVSSKVADLNADGRDDLLLFGRGRFAVLYAGRTDSTLEEVASFESDLEKTFFVDVVAGDLNSDGFTDLAMLDTQSHFVEVLDYDPTLGPRHAVHFPVFEEKSFTDDEGGSGVEPRESTVADLTGDGRPDLVLLVHDRVLVYPQDDGAAPKTETAKVSE